VAMKPYMDMNENCADSMRASPFSLLKISARTIQHPWPKARGMLNESAVDFIFMVSLDQHQLNTHST